MRKPIANKQITSKRYEELKQEYQKETHKETLRKFKILNEAFNIGRKLKGIDYNLITLSIDFEVPYSTCRRVLSLRKANKNTWKLINKGKITSFKAAMVLLQKNVTYQDELIDMVIKENLSTYDIKNLKDGSLKEVNDNRLKIAVDRGFARKHSAYACLCRYLERVDAFSVIDVQNLPKTKYDEIKDRAEKTIQNLNNFKLKLK